MAPTVPSGRGRGIKTKPRGPRVTKFALILWKDCAEPCADVVHIKKISAGDGVNGNQPRPNLQPGMVVTVSWFKDAEKQGQIIQLGAERPLKKVCIDENGNVNAAGVRLLGRRECEMRQTIRHRRGAVQSAADAQLLQTVNDELAVRDHEIVPFKPGELERFLRALPDNPSLEEVDHVVKRLPCLAPQSDLDVQLVKGFPVYINTYMLATLHRLYETKPGAYLSKLLTELVPPKVQRLPNLTAVGKGSTKVGLPEIVLKTLIVYVDNRSRGEYKPHNGFPNAINAILSYERDCRSTENDRHRFVMDPPGPLSRIVAARESTLTVVRLDGPTSTTRSVPGTAGTAGTACTAGTAGTAGATTVPTATMVHDATPTVMGIAAGNLDQTQTWSHSSHGEQNLEPPPPGTDEEQRQWPPREGSSFNFVTHMNIMNETG
ncbi:uncharacterized protein LOC113215597 [Frankliniella occidentalis]|uniref:Uncharacterized protein LOC113215597 n=1 Tax=Frankliniella occidentalis TaxID=133901 RepID=A0A6J1TE51_FRAOC|nr:uncharacterized protein LOC113215597 [Frankliniella occidentalis]